MAILGFLKNPYVIAIVAIVTIVGLLYAYHVDKVGYLEDMARELARARQSDAIEFQDLVDSLYYVLASAKVETTLVRDTFYVDEVKVGYLLTPFLYEDNKLYLNMNARALCSVYEIDVDYRIKAANIIPPTIRATRSDIIMGDIELNPVYGGKGSFWKPLGIGVGLGITATSLTILLLK